MKKMKIKVNPYMYYTKMQSQVPLSSNFEGFCFRQKIIIPNYFGHICKVIIK